jgi:hypothetical protein
VRLASSWRSTRAHGTPSATPPSHANPAASQAKKPRGAFALHLTNSGTPVHFSAGSGPYRKITRLVATTAAARPMTGATMNRDIVAPTAAPASIVKTTV